MPEKLTKYSLDPHSVNGGADKALVFQSALGFNLSNAHLLIEQIWHNLPYFEAVEMEPFKYGRRYRVDMPVYGANGKIAMVRTGWQIDNGSEKPRMTTAYVL
ncbi:MAG: hypothetical protein LBM98_00545 [Oscillospiraceae bacterium]|nr:hypothetical protein [Oscillospiraceae bacterium]